MQTNEVAVEVVRPHPLYSNSPDRQKRLDVAIDRGFIIREILPTLPPTAKYSLTVRGAQCWEFEQIAGMEGYDDANEY